MSTAPRSPSRMRPTLLSRLDGREEDELDAIVRNLDAILNSRAGYAAANGVFGLADTSGYLSARDALELLIASMLEQIARFEPRVELPVLRLVGREEALWARFELTGKVGGQPRRFGIRLHTVFRTVQVKVL